MGRFCIINLGCKVNRVESDTIAAALLAAGAERSRADEADVIVVNTCTVTGEADAKTRKAIRRACREGNCPVIVTGCAAAIDPEGLSTLGDEVTVEPVQRLAADIALAALGNGAAPRLAGPAARTALLAHGERGPATPDASAETDASGAAGPGAAPLSSGPELVGIRAGEGFKTRMDIKIQDGCDNECTYCIVNRARGKARSVPAGIVVASVAAAAEAGVNEVILSGINLGGYASDGLRLPGLIEAILDETSIGRVRVSSIEPPHVDRDLAAALARHAGRLCAHFHIPLQSGCDRTLGEMGRLYDSSEFAARVGLLRDANPGVAITTDVIAGFPGETDSDFRESLEFCREQAFSRMHVFRYSRRPGTPAAERADQVPADAASARAQRLRALADEMAAADIRRRIGRREQVLVMSPTRGMTESYHEVALDPGSRFAKGSLLDLALCLAPDGTLAAR